MDHNIIFSDRALQLLIDVLTAYTDLYISSFPSNELEDDAYYHSCKKILICLMLSRKHDKEYIDCCNQFNPNYLN